MPIALSVEEEAANLVADWDADEDLVGELMDDPCAIVALMQSEASNLANQIEGAAYEDVFGEIADVMTHRLMGRTLNAVLACQYADQGQDVAAQEMARLSVDRLDGRDWGSMTDSGLCASYVSAVQSEAELIAAFNDEISADDGLILVLATIHETLASARQAFDRSFGCAEWRGIFDPMAG